MKKTFLFVLAFALAFNIPVPAQAAWSTLTNIHKAQANKDMSEDKLEDISNQINSLYSLYGSNASDESSAQSGIENDESAESLHTRENLTAAVSSAYESLSFGDKI